MQTVAIESISPLTRVYSTRKTYLEILQILGTMCADSELWSNFSKRIDVFSTNKAATILVKGAYSKANPEDVVELQRSYGLECYKLKELQGIFCAETGDFT